MINLIFEFIWIIISMLLITYGILLYLVRRLSVKLRNLPSYNVWHTAYFPQKIELREDSKENVAFNLEAKRLNFLIKLMNIMTVVFFCLCLIGIVFQEFLSEEKPSWLKN